jgi:hypothetical protein
MKNKTRLILVLLVLIVPSFLSAAFAQSPSGYTVSGDVRDEFGHPAAGVKVCAYPHISEPRRGIMCGQSDEKGKFIIRLTKPSKYGLFYDKASDGYMSQNFPFYRHATAQIPEVNFDDNTPDVTASVVLSPKNGVVRGIVIDAKTNLPVENILITMCQADRPRICFSSSAKNSKGAFKVLASPVPFTMKITADGYEEWLGANGSSEPIFLASGAAMELDVHLKRRADMADAALNEAEKQVGVHRPAPIQKSPKENAEFNHFPRTTRLEWEPVEGAVSYAVEVDYCQRSASSRYDCVSPQPLTIPNNPETSAIPGTSYEFKFVGAQPGRWRVWAIDKEGRAGFKSPWRKFIYLR